MLTSNLRICDKGHKFYKSSNCTVCPVCEKEQNPNADFLIKISIPARRALEREDINTLLKFSEFSETELLKRRDRGPGSIPKLKMVLRGKGLSFRKNNPFK